jgi:Multidrug resistance efflux pump
MPGKPLKKTGPGLYWWLKWKVNLYQRKGAAIDNFETTLPTPQADLAREQAELQEYLDDLHTLLNGSNNLKTASYQTSYLQYQEALQEAKSRLSKTKIDFERSQQLFLEKVVAATEFENTKLDYEQALSAYNMVIQKQRSVWQSEQLQYREQLRNIQSNELQLAEDLKKYVVTTPVSGNVQQLQGIQAGSYVIAGQKIAEISPDTGIVVQCYISPSQIGLIKQERPVFVQVAAFNYNEWGMLKGKVIEIANDVSLIGQQQQPVFKVRCRVDRNYLQLKNGYKGYLQKGMTVTARFVIARRSLLQLLYDKVDNWLNPALAAQ